MKAKVQKDKTILVKGKLGNTIYSNEKEFRRDYPSLKLERG